MRTPLAVLAFLATAMLAAAGCTTSAAQGNPALPPGFAEAQVPLTDLNAYLYVNPGAPVSVPVKWFGKVAGVQGVPPTALLGGADAIGVRRAAVGLGPTIDHFAGSIAFMGEPEAQAAVEFAGSRPQTQAWRTGASAGIVYGNGDWPAAAKTSLQGGGGKPFAETYPEAWELLRMAPASPPAKPMAAGFARVEGDTLEKAASRAGISLSGVGTALGSLKVVQAAFVAYADGNLDVKDRVDPAYFKEHGASAVAIVKSGYPGFLLGFFLNSFSGQAGLEKGTLADGQEVLTRDIGSAFVIVKPIGSVVFLAVAPDKAEAEKVIEAVLKQQK
ncbi:MAG: hypothetical protein HY681_07355 [Chloroflexi bacterium]|nr:hypothetical protein [Chloroflexota bacterium]